MAVRHHEPVTIPPLRIGRIVLEIVVVENLGNIGHAHGHAGMATLGALDGIHGQHAHGVGKFATLGH